MNIFRRMPLIARVSVALIAAAVLPLAYAVWSLFDVNRAGMHEQVLRTHAVAASTAAERIAGAVEARRALAVTVALQEAITADPRSGAARQFLQDLLAADASLQIIDVLTPAGEVVIRAQRRGAAERVGPIPAAGPAVRGSFLLVTESGGGPAVVRVVAEERAILDSLQPVEIGEHAEIILASADGKLLAGAVPLASFPEAMIAAARTARVNGTGVYRNRNGDEILGAFAPVAGTSWFILSRQPAAVAQAIAGRMRRRALLAVSVALAIALLLAVAAHRTIIRPIREVIRTQKALAGNTPLPAGNEIEQLRAASKSLQRRIVDQEELGRIFLGRYQILGIIGQGGMGTVFRGWDPKLRRHVALKTVHLGAMTEGEMDLIESLVAEAITVASVSHPNIVAVYDVEDSTDSAFMAMELVEGVSLQSYLDQRGTLSPELTAMVGLAVARALEAAHARSILHYDIKPANVLLGFDGAIKVADFGLAAIINRVIDTKDSVYGTPGYMAPEVATGQKGDPRADLFALGVVLYHCIVGGHPFDRESAREIILASIYDTPPVLETRMDGGPVLHALSELITALMQKTSEDRPPSASHVVQRLEALVQQHGLRWTIDPLEGNTPLVTGHGSATLFPTIILEPPR